MPGSSDDNFFAVVFNVIKYFSIPSPRLSVRHGFHKHSPSLYSIPYRKLDGKAIKKTVSSNILRSIPKYLGSPFLVFEHV